MFAMQQVQGQPMHMDTPKSRINVPMILASAVAIIGVFSSVVLIALGLVGMVFSWLTTPRQYLIYQNALVIVYGKPRSKVVPFSDIDQLEDLTMPRGDTALGVRLVSGKRAIISVVNLDEFKARLENAWESFKRTGGVQVLSVEEIPEGQQAPVLLDRGVEHGDQLVPPDRQDGPDPSEQPPPQGGKEPDSAAPY